MAAVEPEDNGKGGRDDAGPVETATCGLVVARRGGGVPSARRPGRPLPPALSSGVADQSASICSL